MMEVIIRKKKEIMIYLIALISMVCIIILKNSYHVDELFSFTLSNYKNGWFEFQDGKIYEDVDTLFAEQFSAQNGGLFDYGTVWKNQAGDVHPPLYYMILHTICSITPGIVSDWQPAIVNFIFAILTLWLVRKLFRILLGEHIKDSRYETVVDIAALIFAILPGTLNNVSFFRMYVIAMFMITWVSYVIVKIVNSIFDEKRIERKLWVELFFAAFCSILTHYYCIIYLVLVEAVLFFYLILKKRMKTIFAQVIISGISVCGAVLTFPSMVYHVFSGYRGTEVMDNLVGTSANTYLLQLKSFFSFFDTSMLGGMFGFMLVLAGVYGVYLLWSQINSEKINCDSQLFLTKPMVWVLVIPILIYYLILGKITIYVYARYLFPVYAVAYTVIVASVIELIARMKINKENQLLIILSFLAIVLGGSYKLSSWDYLYLDDSMSEELVVYSELDAIVIYDGNQWKCMTTYKQLENSASVTFVKDSELDLLIPEDISNQKQLIVLAISENSVETMIENMPYINKYKELGKDSSTFFSTYYLYEEDEM